MLGLCLPGAPVLASPASNPDRKLKYTQECVWLARRAVPELVENAHESGSYESGAHESGVHSPASGFWVGVNTSTPNRMLEAAFHASALVLPRHGIGKTRSFRVEQGRANAAQADSRKYPPVAGHPANGREAAARQQHAHRDEPGFGKPV